MKSYISKNRFQLAAVFVVLLMVALGAPHDAMATAAFAFAGVTEAVKSTILTNADATPSVINTAQLANGRVRSARGVCAAATTMAAGSTYRFMRCKSNDLVKELLLDNVTLGAACTMDFGLYKTAADGGAVVDADFFASAVDMNTANRGLDITRESLVITVANMEKPIWQLLALSADPQIEYDIAATVVAATAAAGSMCLSAEFVGRN